MRLWNLLRGGSRNGGPGWCGPRHHIHVKQGLAEETRGRESGGGVIRITCMVFIKCSELALNASTCYME